MVRVREPSGCGGIGSARDPGRARRGRVPGHGDAGVPQCEQLDGPLSGYFGETATGSRGRGENAQLDLEALVQLLMEPVGRQARRRAAEALLSTGTR